MSFVVFQPKNMQTLTIDLQERVGSVGRIIRHYDIDRKLLVMMKDGACLCASEEDFQKCACVSGNYIPVGKLVMEPNTLNISSVQPIIEKPKEESFSAISKSTMTTHLKDHLVIVTDAKTEKSK